MTRVEQRAKQEQRRNREWTNEFKWRPDPVRAVEKRESGRTNKTEEKKGRGGGKNGRISTKPERNEKPSRANEREVSKIFA